MAALALSLLLPALLLFAPVVESVTNATDAAALGVMYTFLNSPPQLSGWSAGGGDPCGSPAWKGVTCSGSSVVAIQLAGFGLNGTLGYRLSDLASLTTLDLSDNNIHDSIPYQLPLNLTYMNLANNNLSANLPYSISTLVSLNYLNLSRNSLSQTVDDLFGNLKALNVLDLSFNNLSGDLPNSLSSLSNLSSLYLQNNQFTGPVNVLSNLELNTLNIANNHFSGWLPQEFNSIQNLITGGNSFANGPAPPPPPYTSPPLRPGGHNRPNGVTQSPETPVGQDDKNQGLTTAMVIGIAAGSAFFACCVLVSALCCLWNARKGKKDSRNDHLVSPAVGLERVAPKINSQEQKLEKIMVTSSKSPAAERAMAEKAHKKSDSDQKPKAHITATSYTVASLQVATNSFGQDCLLGEGSLGRVYRAEFQNGKILAVKKIDSATLSFQDDDSFLEAVRSMSQLKHPNIVQLVGYCAEHRQRLLVYEYIGNGTLHDMLHYSRDLSMALSWNTRVRIALGTARALEYLHEGCFPTIVHRNFKSANILLDEEHNPHLSDCGIAALTPNSDRQVAAEASSFGYSAPEFAMSGVYTAKSDVYSFGVVMLELLTGRMPLDSSRERAEQSLVRWATPQLHDIDALSKMVDPVLNGMYPAKSLSRFADIIALCVQPEPEFRPPMSEVAQQLVRLMQRASAIRRRSGEELGFSYRIPEHEAGSYRVPEHEINTPNY